MVRGQPADKLTRVEGFPDPVAVLSAGRIWRRADSRRGPGLPAGWRERRSSASPQHGEKRQDTVIASERRFGWSE